MTSKILGPAIVAGLAAATGAAHAGGVERSTQSVLILFEEGTYAELAFSVSSPDVSGTVDSTNGLVQFLFGGGQSGDMLETYTTTALSFKTALNDNVDVALIVDEPVGANINYAAGTGYIYADSRAELTSRAVTGLIQYTWDNNFSIFGGVRVQRVQGDVELFLPYSLSTNNDLEYGYVLGMAYEMPEIALRVALTYNSEIEHTFEATENGAASTPFSTKIPQSINLEFQSGVAPDTLVFGSIRWVDWSVFQISPAQYLVLTGGEPLVDYESDSFTFTIGVGRRFNETWSGAISLVHEPEVNNFFGNLGPVDGRTGLGVGVTYNQEAFKITAGVQYSILGNAETRVPASIPGPPNSRLAVFEDNDNWAFGLRVGYRF